jgi:hypothetical protein
VITAQPCPLTDSMTWRSGSAVTMSSSPYTSMTGAPSRPTRVTVRSDVDVVAPDREGLPNAPKPDSVVAPFVR